jgi:hypothetical protein
LGHAAGLTHEASIGNNYDASFPDYDSHYKSIQNTWLRCPVGSEYHYSNLGFDIAAQIIEKVTGMPYYEYLKQKLFIPLQMTSTTANPDDLAGNPNTARGNLFGLTELPYKVPYIGAGGIYTNAVDLVKFVQFHLNFGRVNNNQLLAVKYLNEMYTPFIINNYALGINIDLSNDSYSLFHNGSGYGFGSSMKWYPEYGIGCVVLCNYQIECVLEKYATRLLNDYIKANNLQKLQSSGTFFPSKANEFKQSGNTVDCITVCYTPAKNNIKPGTTIYKWKDIYFKDEWKKYTGTYKIKLDGGFKLTWYASIAGFIGITPKIKVYQKDKYLYLQENPMGTGYTTDVQLFEYLPGLFFTSDGEALDFRTKDITYRNLKLE